MKSCKAMSQPFDGHCRVLRERPEHEPLTHQACRDNSSTYNTTLGLGLNVQLENSIAWGERKLGKFKGTKW